MTVYEAVQDTDETDPRTWGSLAPLAIYAAGSGGRFPTVHDNGAVSAFLVRVALSGDVDQSVAVANRWSRVFDNGDQVSVHHVTGYSQGDWWNIVTTGDAADVETFRKWLVSDVWTVTEYEERTCDLGEVHRMFVDQLSGIYADTEAGAIAQYQEG